MTEDLDDLDWLAAEYVLGTLGTAERRDAAARTERDPAFAALVDAWAQRLGPIEAAIAPVAPPIGLWPRIEAAIPKTAQSSAPKDSLWDRIGFWRAWSLGASAIAAALALFIVTADPLVQGEDRFVAILNTGDQQPAWLVTVDVKAGNLTIRPLLDVAAADRDYELWMITGPETPPRSLGLLDQGGEIAIPISLEVKQAAPNVPALAVSLEPAGGSATGLPTGPVLFQGTLLRLEGGED